MAFPVAGLPNARGHPTTHFPGRSKSQSQTDMKGHLGQPHPHYLSLLKTTFIEYLPGLPLECLQ